MTSLADYIAATRTATKKPGADIRQRWQERIVSRGLPAQGVDGADAYIRDYGRGISAAKVAAFAVLAEQSSCPAIANGFWIHAHRLAGHVATLAEIAALLAAAGIPAGPMLVSATAPPAGTTVPDLPAHLQPGALVTQQPVDATRDRAAYIANPCYGGQPKRDGNRLVVTATEGGVFYQSRSLRIRPSPDRRFDTAFRAVVPLIGTFIVDGELVYLDAAGGEHRTGAQAATANVEAGCPEGRVVCQISIFKALFARGVDLTTAGERDRIRVAAEILSTIAGRPVADGLAIELVPTAISTAEKQALADGQRAEGREGEVWFRLDAPYRGGKREDSAEEIVRTKYLEESEVVIVALTPTSVPGRLFGAIEVAASHPDGAGRPLGRVGTGFSAADAAEIAQAVGRRPAAGVRIVVKHQGFTEGGLLWHARYERLAA